MHHGGKGKTASQIENESNYHAMKRVSSLKITTLHGNFPPTISPFEVGHDDPRFDLIFFAKQKAVKQAHFLTCKSKHIFRSLSLLSDR